MRDAQLVEPRRPLLEFGSRRAREREMVQARAGLVERCCPGGLVGVDAEELAARQRPDRVVVGPLALVLVENRIGTEQGRVPASAAVEVADGDGDVRDGGEVGYGEPLGSGTLSNVSLAGSRPQRYRLAPPPHGGRLTGDRRV